MDKHINTTPPHPVHAFRLTLITHILSASARLFLLSLIVPALLNAGRSYMFKTEFNLSSHIRQFGPVSVCMLFVIGTKLYCFKSKPLTPPRLSWKLLAVFESGPLCLVFAYTCLAVTLPRAFNLFPILSVPHLPLLLASATTLQCMRNAITFPSTIPLFQPASVWLTDSSLPPRQSCRSWVSVSVDGLIYRTVFALGSVAVPVSALNVTLLALGFSAYFPSLLAVLNVVVVLVMASFLTEAVEQYGLRYITSSVLPTCSNTEILNAVNCLDASPFTKHCALQALIDQVASSQQRRELVYTTQPDLKTWTTLHTTLVAHMTQFTAQINMFDSQLLHGKLKDTGNNTQPKNRQTTTNPKFVWPSDLVPTVTQHDLRSESESMLRTQPPLKPWSSTVLKTYTDKVKHLVTTHPKYVQAQHSLHTVLDRTLHVVRLVSLSSEFQVCAYAVSALTWFLVHAFDQDVFGQVFPTLAKIVPALLNVLDTIDQVLVRTSSQWTGWMQDTVHLRQKQVSLDQLTFPVTLTPPLPLSVKFDTCTGRLAFVYDVCTCALLVVCAKYPSYVLSSVYPKLSVEHQVLLDRIVDLDLVTK